MVEKHLDPWQKVKTVNNLAADEVISALQKEIRRGHTENACLLAYELLQTSSELEQKLWQRLLVISVEDVGLGNQLAAVLVNALFQMHLIFRFGEGDRALFAIHAVRILSESEKDRSSDELLCWIKMTDARPEIPEYALDMHTRQGQDLGRGFEHFILEAAKVVPEKSDRNTHYRELLIKILGLD